MPTSIQTIKVKQESQPNRVAGAIAHAVRERQFRQELELEIQVIGERAINVAVKALAKAQTYLAKERPDLYLAMNPRAEVATLDGMTYHGYVFALGWLALP